MPWSDWQPPYVKVVGVSPVQMLPDPPDAYPPIGYLFGHAVDTDGDSDLAVDAETARAFVAANAPYSPYPINSVDAPGYNNGILVVSATKQADVANPFFPTHHSQAWVAMGYTGVWLFAPGYNLSENLAADIGLIFGVDYDTIPESEAGPNSFEYIDYATDDDVVFAWEDYDFQVALGVNSTAGWNTFSSPGSPAAGGVLGYDASPEPESGYQMPETLPILIDAYDVQATVGSSPPIFPYGTGDLQTEASLDMTFSAGLDRAYDTPTVPVALSSLTSHSITLLVKPFYLGAANALPTENFPDFPMPTTPSPVFDHNVSYQLIVQAALLSIGADDQLHSDPTVTAAVDNRPNAVYTFPAWRYWIPEDDKLRTIGDHFRSVGGADVKSLIPGVGWVKVRRGT